MLLTFYKLYNMNINQHGASHSMLNYQYKQINAKKKKSISINYTDDQLITRVKIHQGIIPTYLKEISTETLRTSTEVYISISIYIKHTAFYIQTHGTSFLKENVFTASLQYWIEGAHVSAAMSEAYPEKKKKKIQSNHYLVVSHSVCHCTTFFM